MAPFSEEAYKKDLGVNALWGEKGYSSTERTGIRPTLELNGIWGGYTGEGSKTVLPSKATAKISARLVPNQSSQKITGLLIDHFGWRSEFWFAMCAGILIVAAAFFAVHETHGPEKRATSTSFFGGYAILMRDARFLAFVSQSGFMSVSFFAISAPSSRHRRTADGR